MNRRKSNRRGSAILSVTLLGLLILAISAALMSITTTFNQRSFASNKQIVCRYAAEGILQRIKYQIALEDAGDTGGGWFDTARTATDPVETVSIGANADASNVVISIYDPTEALSALGVTLGTDEYIVEARSTSANNTSTLQMKVKYNLTTTLTTYETPDPMDSFSKYAFWSNTSGTLIPGDSTGYMHVNGDLTLGGANDRFAMPVTCTGSLTFKDIAFWKHFDFDRNGLLGTTPRPEFGGLSEQDSYLLSGGGKPAVDKPNYADVDTILRAAAVTQTASSPALAALYVDATNPLYAGLGALQTSTVNFVHDPVGGVTTANITVTGSLGTVTQSVSLPPGQPLILYSTPRVSSAKGSVYAQITIATPYKGAPTTGDIGGGTYTVLNPPSISVTDHLMLVDQQGRPKTWLYDKSLVPKPQPTRLSYTGIPQSSSGNIDNDTGSWTPTQYDYLRNPAYAAATIPVLGLISTGDITVKPGTRNIIFNGAYYAGDPDSRVSSDPSLLDTNHTNVCVAGSRISSMNMAFGDYENIFRTFDTDFLTMPPPYWVVPMGVTTTTTTTTTITTSVGSVYDRTRKH